jgi:hypothetical protein
MRKRSGGLVAALMVAAALAGCWSPTEPPDRDPKSDTDGDGKNQQVGFALGVPTPPLG